MHKNTEINPVYILRRPENCMSTDASKCYIYGINHIHNCIDFNMGNRRKKDVSRTVNEMLGLVPEISHSVFKLTVICADNALVQNFGRVYEYTDKCVAFLAEDINMLCEIHGEGLCLHGMNAYSIRITGHIKEIRYTGDNA